MFRALPILVFIPLVGCQRPPLPTEQGFSPAQFQRPAVSTHLAPVIRNEKGEPGTLRFDMAVENDSPSPVRFTGVHRSCTCTTVALDAMALEPGERTRLRFEVDLRSRTGPQRFECVLEEATGARWAYEARTAVYEWASFDAHVYSFGLLNPNESVEKSGALAVFGHTAAELPGSVEFKVDSQRLQVIARDPVTEVDPEGVWVRKFPFQLRIKAPAAAGGGSGTVFAHMRFAAGADRCLHAACAWNTRSLFETTPSLVYLDWHSYCKFVGNGCCFGSGTCESAYGGKPESFCGQGVGYGCALQMQGFRQVGYCNCCNQGSVPSGQSDWGQTCPSWDQTQCSWYYVYTYSDCTGDPMCTQIVSTTGCIA